MEALNKKEIFDKKDYINELKTCLLYVAVAVAMGVLVYLSLMANDLVNNLDGIWHPSNFIAGDWEISLGRGLQRYADRARFGLVSSSWNSIIFFAVFGLADYLIIRKFSITNTIYSFLFVFITIANPIVCESLTYSYMSINFALAYLFSVIAFAIIPVEKGRSKAIKFIGLLLLASLSFGVSMAFYQAYIGVFAVLSIVWIVCCINTKEKIKDALLICVNHLLVFAMGGAIYYVVTKLLLLRAGVEMASYKGASNVGVVSIIQSFPVSIKNAYRETFDYIIIKRFNSKLEFSFVMVVLVLAASLIVLLAYLYSAFKKKLKNGMLTLGLLIILPVASSCICIIAVGNTITGLMAMGILLLFPIMIVFASDKKALKCIMYCSMLLLSWYLVSSVENDQIALKEGSIATESIADGILKDINSSPLRDKTNCLAIVGRAADNPQFYKSEAYEMANGYAMFGRWSTDARNNRVTWDGIMKSMLGTNMTFCDDSIYQHLIETETVKKMPIYPSNGYIQEIEGIMVIKVSDVY